MELDELYEALEYAKYGNDLCDHHFQLDTGLCKEDRFNGIWLAGLFTLLIKEAGRLCDDHASDIFYDLQNLHRDLYGNDAVIFDQDTYRAVIGIRESGVDGETFMSTRAEQEEGCVYHYREIFLITVTPSEKWEGDKKLSCYRVSPWQVDSFLKRKRVYAK